MSLSLICRLAACYISLFWCGPTKQHLAEQQQQQQQQQHVGPQIPALPARIFLFSNNKKSNLGNANQHFLQIQCTLLLAAPPPLPSPPLSPPLPGSTYIHYPWTILTGIGKHRETRIAGTYLQVQVGRYVSVVVRNHTNDAHPQIRYRQNTGTAWSGGCVWCAAAAHTC